MIIGGVDVRQLGDSFTWTSGLECDVDGSPFAYADPHADANPLDDLANAGHPGNWWSLACSDGGLPYVQQVHDPAPGYYVSMTSLVDHSRSWNEPQRYVDATEVPYLALPPELIRAGAVLGSLAMVAYGDTLSPAIVADVGPRARIGEGSFALHKALGADPQRALPKHRLVGIDENVMCVVFCGTAKMPPWPREVAEFSAIADGHFLSWGGMTRLRAATAPRL